MKKLSKNLVQIASILSDLHYHDGDTIGQQLGISRSAVWKHIKKMEECGVKINSVKNKGYLFQEPLLLLDENKIKAAFKNITIEIFEEIDSTNNYLKRCTKATQKQICIAESQNAGRGRNGNSWHSPFGQNIYLSYNYEFSKAITELSGLSLVVGIAILNAIKEIGINAAIKLKWPNDGIFQGKKIMGNLIDLQSEAYGETKAIIGIGINVNMLNDQLKIDQKWSSLRAITGKYIDRNELVIAIIHNLNFYLEQFSKFGLKEFLTQWHQLDDLYNKNIKLNNSEFIGVAKGIDAQGNLIVELTTGEIKNFSSGEVTIAKQ
jgi:BirA family biotin operon repressor/biotin-[acetyl-CoA-carboxylase] ligase